MFVSKQNKPHIELIPMNAANFLIFVIIMTRPHILSFASIVSQFTDKPEEWYWEIVKGISGIHQHNEKVGQLEIYSDTNYVIAPHVVP